MLFLENGDDGDNSSTTDTNAIDQTNSKYRLSIQGHDDCNSDDYKNITNKNECKIAVEELGLPLFSEEASLPEPETYDPMLACNTVTLTNEFGDVVYELSRYSRDHGSNAKIVCRLVEQTTSINE